MRATCRFFVYSVVLAAILFAGDRALASGVPTRAERFAAAVNVPTAGCSEILTQDALSALDAKAVSPAEEFEAHRRAHPHMIEFPLPMQCELEAWMILHGKSQPADRPSGQVPVPLAPTIGADVDMASGVSGYQGETSIAVDPNNPLHLVAGANTFYRDPSAACQSPTGGSAKTYGTQALYGSTDGGSTWAYQCAPWPSGVTGGVTGAAYWFGSDPAMVYDQAGNAYAVYMLVSQNSAGTASGASIVIAKSTNNGASWSNLGIIVNRIGTSTSMDDKEMVAIDTTSGQAHSHTGRIYVIWDEGNVERVAYSDNGTTWTTVNVDTSGDIGGNVAVTADGTVWATWNRYSTTGGTGGAGDKLYVKKSTDGGVTWTAPATNPIVSHNLASFGTNNKPPAQNSRGINAFPIIDVDRNPSSAYFGRVYIAYCDFPSGTGSGADLNVYMVNSANGGTTWSSQLLVNDDGGTGSQFFPWMNVDQSDGTVNISWLDTRNSSTVCSGRTANACTQIYGTRSIDGGTTREANLKLEDTGANFLNKVAYSDENSADNTAYNGNQYGDYTGIMALNRVSHSMWGDSRNLFPTSNTKIEDSAATAVTFCTAPTGVPTPSLSCSGSSVLVTWGAPSSWGTNATGGTYSVIRFTDAACTQNRTVLSTSATSPYTDASGTPGTTYYYEIQATNNCPGTALTPMSSTSGCSAGISCGGCTPPATPTASNNGPICAGSALNLSTATVAGATYAWTGPNGFTSTSQNPSIASATTAATGTYSVRVTVNGCQSAAGTTSATVNAIPATPTASSNSPICAGSALNLTTATVAGATYAWTGPNGFTSTSQSPSIASATTAATGTYSVVVTGANGCSSPLGTTSATVNADNSAPVVAAPAPVTIAQSTCCGTFGGDTSATSSALAAFLAGGSATDDCVASPTRLAPQVGGSDVTASTCFEVGATTVTFRFQDLAGHVGSATSSATVQMYGDLNLDGVVDPTDMVVLRAYFNFVATPGTPPFNAPLSLADVNHDAVVDPTDSVILRGYLNLLVSCLAP